jgi:uncharacterized protein YkwD
LNLILSNKVVSANLVTPILILSLIFFLMVERGYPRGDQSSPGPADQTIQEFLRLVNAKRRSIGCPELKWDSQLALVALKHSRDMVSRNFFGHTNPDGKGPFERLQESKVVFSAAAENIASGPKTGRQVFETWLSSPGHRKNMLDCRFTRHGVAYVEGRWTHLLLKPR